MYFDVPDAINIDLYYVLEGKIRIKFKPLSNQSISPELAAPIELGPGEYFDYHKLNHGQFDCHNKCKASITNRIVESI